MARRTLSTEVREGILRDLAAGINKATIAHTYGVSVPTVYNFLHRQAAAAQTVAPVETATATAVAPVATRTARKSTRVAR